MILSLDDAAQKARCAECVQLFFAFYKQEYSNFSNSLFFVEREKISNKKKYYPA